MNYYYLYVYINSKILKYYSIAYSIQRKTKRSLIKDILIRSDR